MCEVDLSKDEIDYIISNLIADSLDLTKLKYENIFEIFEAGK